MTGSKKKNAKRTALLLSLFGTIGVLGFAQSDWLSVSMQPKGKSVELGTLTGVTLIPALSAIGMFLVAAVVMLSLVRGWAARLFAALIGAAGAIAIVLTLQFLSNPSQFDASGQMKTWKQIAEAHDVTQLSTVVSATPWLVLVSIALLLIAQVRVILSAGQWPKRPANGSQTAQATNSENQPEDAISIWDSQRQK